MNCKFCEKFKYEEIKKEFENNKKTVLIVTITVLSVAVVSLIANVFFGNNSSTTPVINSEVGDFKNLPERNNTDEPAGVDNVNRKPDRVGPMDNKAQDLKNKPQR